MLKKFYKTTYFLMSAILMLCVVWLTFPLQTIRAEKIEVETVDTNSSNSKLPVVPAKKRALLVGISKYCKVAGECGRGKPYWWDLNTEAEVGELARILKDPNGQYKFDEVKILKDAEATHQNIVNTFKTFLIDQTNEGDVAYFHYSGHGGQVPDDTQHGPNPKVGDEIDGYDETIIPIDYTKGKTGFNDIRDDEIGDLLDKLQAKKPANTTLTFDSCFSGTIQRGGDSVVRGESWEGKPATTRGGNDKAKEDSPSGLLESNPNQKGGYVLMSATRNDQVANETPKDEQTGKPMGVFTSALTKALRKAGAETTYRDIFQSVSDDVSRSQKNNQNPQLEGNLDQKLMSGTVRNPSPYIAVTLAQNDQDVILKAGKFMGVTVGSEFSIYENGKDAKGQPLTKAVVELTADLTAKLKITPAPTKAILEKLKTGRAIETKHGFGDMRLKVGGEVSLISNRGSNENDLINKQSNVEDADVRICRGKCPNELPDGNDIPKEAFITLQRRIGGSVIARVLEKEDKTSEKLIALIENEARWRFFNTLKDGGDQNLNDKVKIRLVPVKVTEKKSMIVANGGSATLASKTEDMAKEVSTNRGGNIELKEGDTVMLEVANLSGIDLYVTVIDITGNGSVKPLFPHPVIPVGNSSENKFSPTTLDSKGRPIYQRIPCPFVINITPPFGSEVFRVIATTEATDFSALLNPNSIHSIQNGSDVRGAKEAKTPFGKLLMTAMTGQTARMRGDIFGADTIQQVSLENPALTISSIMIDVKPK